MARLSSVAAVAVLAATMAVASVAPASSQLARSLMILDSSTTNDLVTSVRYRGRRGAGIGLGIAAGAIIGGIIASQGGPYYYGAPGYHHGYYPGYYPTPGVYAAPGDAVGYCMSRFRSYDPVSGTYLGYDGFRHPCP